MSIVETQLRFLLEQAPMLDAPADIERAAHAVTRFAYIHPATFEKFTTQILAPGQGNARIYPSPTSWEFTILMPEGRVIYSPNAMPGL